MIAVGTRSSSSVFSHVGERTADSLQRLARGLIVSSSLGHEAVF
jgi:hypothetical protein